MSDLTTLTGMTIDVGKSGDQRVYKRESEEGNTNTKNKEEGDAKKENISNQMGETVTRKNNNDVASVSSNPTGVDMTESHPVINQSLNTVSESDDASHITTLTDLTMEGEVKLEGTADKKHPKIRADIQPLDTNNSGSDDGSQNTVFTGLTMEGNTNIDTVSISNVVEGASSLNLDAKTIKGDDDNTVLSGLTIDDDPKIQNNNEDPQIQSDNIDSTDFQQGRVN
eukprot:2645056-Ditylum_brightwellii.AAC.1